jgi:hypothetical protein
MDVILKARINGTHDHSSSDTSGNSPEPSPTDPWLFTDPFACAFYRKAHRINLLEEDIRMYVMYDGTWASEELEYKLEVRRLLQEGIITAVGSFGSLSPHPTVYGTLKEGNLRVTGREYSFNSGESLIFEPWLSRYSDPGLNGPFRIDKLYPVSSLCLCCDSFPHICIHCDKTRAIMRQILNYRNSK